MPGKYAAMPEEPKNDGSAHLTRQGWEAAVSGAGPASLLLVIEQRLGPLLQARVTPEDILQESLLHAWRDRQSHRWRGPRPFRNWILSLIDHRIADWRDYAGALKRGGNARTVPLAPGGHGSRLGGGWRPHGDRPDGSLRPETNSTDAPDRATPAPSGVDLRPWPGCWSHGVDA